MADYRDSRQATGRQVSNQINYIGILKELWNNILVIALAAAIMGAAAFGYTTVFLAPTYTATVSLYINNNTFDLGLTNFITGTSMQYGSAGMISTYGYVLLSRTTLEEVIREADLPYTPDGLRSRISAQGVEGTAVLEISVTSSKPAETELIANTIAKVLPERIVELVDGTNARVIDYAIIPARRSGPDLTGNTTRGMTAGAAIAAVLVLLVAYLKQQTNMVISSVDELHEMYPDLTVLSMIPDVRSSEKDGYYSDYYSSKRRYGSKKRKEKQENG